MRHGLGRRAACLAEAKRRGQSGHEDVSQPEMRQVKINRAFFPPVYRAHILQAEVASPRSPRSQVGGLLHTQTLESGSSGGF